MIPIPTDFVKKQIDVLFEDVRIDSVKIGMLFDSNLIKGVAERLRYWNPRYIVLDPVMVAKSEMHCLRTTLWPLCAMNFCR